MGVLYLNLQEASGVQLLERDISSHLTLRNVCITWDSLVDSTSSVINLRLDKLSEINRTGNQEIPLFNDITKQTTMYASDLPITFAGHLSREIRFSLHDSDGAHISNIKSVQLVFSY